MTQRIFRGRVLALMGIIVAGSFGAGGAAFGNAGAPYSDPNAVGYIGLCNQAGQQITSGNITTKPFAWRAVSSQAAQAPYNNAGRTAILLAYQPQQGLVPGEWSGEELTASSRYTNPANPMVAATNGDDSLSDFIQDFSPRWDGFLQLRMYLGTANAQPYSLHYPTLDIQVSGDTWTAVGGGPVNCQSGTAESLESIVLPPTTTTTTSVPATTTLPSTTKPTSSAAKTSGKKTPEDALPASSAAADHGSSSNHVLIVVVVVIVALGAAAFILLALRRRRVSQFPQTDTPSLPKKGP